MQIHKNLIYFFTTILLLPTQSMAWNFNEHRELGENSYLKACRLLATALKKDPREALLKSIPCSDIGVKSRQYGVRAALAGDHVKDPKDFESISAEEQALSWVHYGRLAMENYEHFWPHVKTSWRNYHDRALDLAVEAKQHWQANKHTKSIITFERALMFSAYADHFLQDSFSIGHSGFSRINSVQNPSLIFHDEWNNTGRLLSRKKHHINYELLDVKTDNIMHEVLFKNNNSCHQIVTINRTVEECNLDQWKAFGDGALIPNSESQIRIEQTNTYSIISVILSFIDGKDRGYSMLAENMFPVSSQSFQQTSLYASYFDGNKGKYNASYPDPFTGECPQKDGGVYKLDRKCWFDLENSFMEPVYPDITIGINKVYLGWHNTDFYALYIAYNPYSPKYFSSWPKNIRLYYLLSLNDTDITIGSTEISTYREIGINLVLPNLYGGTLVSHEIDVAYAFLASKRGDFYESLDKKEEGGYVGLNTNLDFMKAKLSFGVGLFMPSSKFSEAEYKAQIMFGWNFGVLGGGPLSRWE